MCCHQNNVKNNGFTKLPHIFQIGSYFIFSYLIFIQYSILYHSQEEGEERISCLIISSILLLSVITSTIVSAVTDPTDPVVKEYKKIAESGQWFDVMKYKLYCEQCASYVSDTSKHCKRCDSVKKDEKKITKVDIQEIIIKNRCVQNFDHHCKWINNCVGQSNYRSFFVMIVSVMFYSLFELIQQLVCIVRLHKNTNVMEDQTNLNIIGLGFMIYIAVVLTLLVFILIVNLVFLHIWLISKKMTTYEYILLLREQKKIQDSEKMANLQAKKQQEAEEESAREEKEKIKGIAIKIEKQDHQSDQSSKSGGNGEDEFEEQKSNVMNNEVRKHRTSFQNNKKEISIYSIANNKPDKVDLEAHLETNRTKKQINFIQNEKGRKSNECQLINEPQQEINEQSGSLINRSINRLSKMVSLKMIFTQKEFDQVSQPQSRKQSVTSMQQQVGIKLNYNQSDNIFFDRSKITKAPQPLGLKVNQFNQKIENSTPTMAGRSIIKEQPNKLFKNSSSQLNNQQDLNKIYSSSAQNPQRKSHELNQRQFSPGKIRQGLETKESIGNQLNIQKRLIGNSINNQEDNENKGGSESFDIHILDEKYQVQSIPIQIQSFQNDTSILNQLNQSIDENNKTRDKILIENQFTQKNPAQLIQLNNIQDLSKRSDYHSDDNNFIDGKDQNNLEDLTNTHKNSSKEQSQLPIQFKIQSKLQIEDFEQK